MRTVLPIIIYSWLAVSLFIYGRRIYRRASGEKSSAAPGPSLPSAGTPGARPTHAAGTSSSATPRVPHVPRSTPGTPAVPPPFDDGIPIAPPAFDADGTPHMDATHFPIEPSVAAALAEEGRLSTPGVAAPTEPPPDAGRSGLFAKAGDAPPAAAALTTLMANIALPCDLAPLVSLDDAHLADVQARFVTGGHDPAEVGREVGDELERLGFTLASLSDTQVLATRDDGRLTVTIHTKPHTIEVDGRRLFPTTGADDVVVEFVSG